MPWPLPSAKIYGHDATMRGFRTEHHALAGVPPRQLRGSPHTDRASSTKYDSG